MEHTGRASDPRAFYVPAAPARLLGLNGHPWARPGAGTPYLSLASLLVQPMGARVEGGLVVEPFWVSPRSKRAERK